VGIGDPEQRLGLPREVCQARRPNTEQRPELMGRTAAVLENEGRIDEQLPGKLVVSQGSRYGTVDLPP